MKSILGIQILRFFAAMLVVVMHASQAINNRLGNASYWKTGAVGVDIFFVISGFVMMYTSPPISTDLSKNRGNAFQFLRRRFIRIIPLYWVFTTLKLFIILIFPFLALRTKIDFSHLIHSYIFIPIQSPWGNMEPFLPVGWTLNFEMFFYIIFAIGIALGLSRILFSFAFFFVIYILGFLNLGNQQLEFYSSSVIFEFILGCLLVPLLRMGRKPLVGLLLVLTSIAAIFVIETRLFTDHFLRYGLPSASLVLGVLYLEDWFIKFNIFRRLEILGDSSYSLYLSHTFIVPLVVGLCIYSSISNVYMVIFIALLISIISGLLTHIYFENPMLRKLKEIL